MDVIQCTSDPERAERKVIERLSKLRIVWQHVIPIAPFAIPLRLSSGDHGMSLFSNYLVAGIHPL